MKFTHGSPKNLKDNDRLSLFNYTIRHDGTSTEESVNEGIDGEGIGIYAWIGQNEDAINNALHYTEEGKKFVYLLDVDVEEEDLLNNRPNDELSPEIWAEGINDFIETIRNEQNMNYNNFSEVLYRLEEGFDELTFNRVEEELKLNNIDLNIDEYCDPNNFDDYDDWRSQMEETYSTSDPCSHIMEEGGPESLAEYAINKSDNLWETLKNIGYLCAYTETGKGIEKHLKTFQESINGTLEEYKLDAGIVNDGKFAVIFNTDLITIENKLDFSNDLELNSSLENSIENFIDKKELDKKDSKKENKIKNKTKLKI